MNVGFVRFPGTPISRPVNRAIKRPALKKQHSTLPASWDITSDSIAAWLAREMSAAHLLLVKYQSVKTGQLVIGDLQASGIIDKGFGGMLSGVDFEWLILGKGEYAGFSIAD